MFIPYAPVPDFYIHGHVIVDNTKLFHSRKEPFRGGLLATRRHSGAELVLWRSTVEG